MTVASPAHAVTRRASRTHIIDVLIAERAPKLAASPVWPLARPLLYRLLDYGKARRMADAIGPMGGRQALDYVSDLLGLDVTVQGLERTPAAGRVVVVCNHPTGIADGIAAYDALRGVRPDLVFYANADAHRVSARLSDVLIPVEWVENKRTRDKTRTTLQMTREAMEAERCLVIFPAGRLARRQPDGALCDPVWMSSAVSIARKYEAPVLPVHVEGPWSTLFHLFHGVSQELRDITLFHEMLNKRGRPFRLIVGPVIPPSKLEGDPVEATAALKRYVEGVLPNEPERPF
ncbi:GNAT family N-acetyltransferase [Phenylobacterium deserti]|uniref:Acyltransferase n=1 Tax=Phenylobacterium deserti TaxID=1914756 RepID=A0A328AW78_9CAUL|nr:1-acyl-sn-glycerol-3-phosphate acyltransferase [Phenylobacterium deserti]RAK57108.1 acyltransferase [Phenylobacterium deserti]